MTCNNCGSSNEPNAKFCAVCGASIEQVVENVEVNEQPVAEVVSTPEPAPYYEQPVQTTQPANPGQGFAIAGMVCGIVSFFVFAFITGLLGIIFGCVAKSKGNKSGMATAGIVCGSIGIALWLIMLVACGSLFAFM